MLPLKQQLQLLKATAKLLDNQVTFYLYGTTLRNLLLGGFSNNDINVMVFNASDKDFNHLINLPLTNIKLIRSTKKVPYIQAHRRTYTVDELYAEFDDKGILSVKSNRNGIDDYNKQVLKITRHQKERPFYPKLLLNSILISTRYKLELDYKSFNYLYEHRESIKNLDKRYIFKFLKRSFYTNNFKKRIDMMNAFGIGIQLFGVPFFSITCRQLKYQDVWTYLAILTFNVEITELQDKLIQNGFTLAESHLVYKFRQLLEAALQDVNVKTLLDLIEHNEFFTLVRGMRTFKLREEIKQLRYERSFRINRANLKVTLEDIQAAFRVSESGANKMLDKATQAYMIGNITNDKYSILSYLNKE